MEVTPGDEGSTSLPGTGNGGGGGAGGGVAKAFASHGESNLNP